MSASENRDKQNLESYPALFKPFTEGQDTRVFHINLPHWRQDGVTYFLTWRLADSLPQVKLRMLEDERKLWLHAHHIETRNQINSLPEKQRHDFHRRFTATLND